MLRLMQAQSAETGSRTDALKPLVYAMGILFTATVGLVWRSAPAWLLIVVATLLVIATIGYFAAYAYCLLSNPDLLRSETYGLRKMAIERGVLGDSDSGLQESRALLQTSSSMEVALPQREANK